MTHYLLFYTLTRYWHCYCLLFTLLLVKHRTTIHSIWFLLKFYQLSYIETRDDEYCWPLRIMPTFLYRMTMSGSFKGEPIREFLKINFIRRSKMMRTQYWSERAKIQWRSFLVALQLQEEASRTKRGESIRSKRWEEQKTREGVRFEIEIALWALAWY